MCKLANHLHERYLNYVGAQGTYREWGLADEDVQGLLGFLAIFSF